MKTITRQETISPDQATRYLSKNTQNRKIRESVVDHYANMMKRNQWLMTHQGICFSDDDVLLDGQHRLLAIVKAGIPVSMLVTRGVSHIMDNGSQIDVMDVIDCGKMRSVGDQLQLSHGIPNPNSVAGACNIVARICCGARFHRVSTPQALAINRIYSEQIQTAIKMMSYFKPGRISSIVGALAFAMKSHPAETIVFAEGLASGEGLKKSSSVLTLRNWIVNTAGRGIGRRIGGPAGVSHIDRDVMAEIVLNMVYAHIEDRPLTQVRRAEGGVEWFRAKQRTMVARVAEILGGIPKKEKKETKNETVVNSGK